MHTCLRLVIAAACAWACAQPASAAVAAAFRAAASRAGAAARVPGAALPLSPVRPTGALAAPLSAPRALSPALSSVMPSARAAVAALPRAAAPQAAVGALPAPPLKTAAAVRPRLPAPPKAALPADRRAGKNARTSLNAAGAGVAAARKSGDRAALRSILGGLFDGARRAGAAAFAADLESRLPDWSEDRRINRALRRLADSPVGLDLYRYVYERHPQMQIRVDDARGADYDAKLSWEDERPVLTLTESLVDNESVEVIAAYVAREMSHVYFASFPESAERDYMGYGSMVRVYAELTDSGLKEYGYWWDTDHDQWAGDAYTMRRTYGSWKEAVSEAYYGTSVRRSAFFRWLKSVSGKPTLRQLYRRGQLGWREHREMDEYFERIVTSEQSWFSDTGRW